MEVYVNVDSFITAPRARLAPDDSCALEYSSQHPNFMPQSKDPTIHRAVDFEEHPIQPPSGIDLEREHLPNFNPPTVRRLQAFCSLYTHQLLAVLLIAAVISGCALWQGLVIWMDDEAYHIFGPGVVAAKAFAGALYPSIAILLASSSRRLQTFCRNNAYLRRSPIWDLGQVIHSCMAVLVVIFGSGHAISHLGGTFRHGSQTLGKKPSPHFSHGQVWSYTRFLYCIPGASGIALLVFVWAMLLTSLPSVRRRHFEVFRWVHFLVHPLIAILCVHGTSSLLQRPQVGYWIALPTILVLYEKGCRIAHRRAPVTATISVIDDVVKVVCFEGPDTDKQWHIKPGQYIMLNMPAVDKIQWHPFTVSSCGEDFIELHIKCTIGWTERLRLLVYEQALQHVYLSGPFGAPAQRYNDYRHVIMIGCGIGITPLSAILQSMTVGAVEKSFDLPSDEVRIQHLSTTSTREYLEDQGPRIIGDDNITLKSACSTPANNHETALGEAANRHLPPSATTETQEIDVHLVVREQKNLATFTRLFGALYTSRNHVLSGNLSINLGTYLTSTKEPPTPSVQTQAKKVRAGALYRHTNYGRPNIEYLLRKHFLDLVARNVDRVDVAVFVSRSQTYASRIRG